MHVGANLLFFFAAKLVLRRSVRAVLLLVSERVIEDLHERVGVIAVHFPFAVHPAVLLVKLGAPLWVVAVLLRRPAEVLHAVRVVAVRPVVLFIQDWTE